MIKLIDIAIGAAVTSVLFIGYFSFNVKVYNYYIDYAENQAENWGKTEFDYSQRWNEVAENLKQDKRYFVAYFKHSNTSKYCNPPPHVPLS
jgi:hypothetical protein